MIAGLSQLPSFADPIISYGTDTSTGFETITQTITIGSGPLNANENSTLFTFMDFNSLINSQMLTGMGINYTYKNDTTFDYQFTQTVNSFTVTNNDTSGGTDQFVGTVTSAVNLDTATTMPNSNGSGDRKTVTGDLGIGYVGNTPQSLAVTLVNSGLQTLPFNSTFTYPGTPITVTGGVSWNINVGNMNNACSFGDVNSGDGCTAALTANGTYSGNGSFIYGLDATGAFSVAGGGSTPNVDLTVQGSATQTAEAEVTYEFTTSATSLTPEPTTMVLFGSALVGLGLLRRRVS
jgi:hypothetical protein